MNLNSMVERVIAINHAWKLARVDFGASSPITVSLREQKSSWQVNILRNYPNASFLQLATDSELHDEELLSVRLVKSIETSQGVKHDAEHIPKRLAELLLSPTELKKFTRKD